MARLTLAQRREQALATLQEIISSVEGLERPTLLKIAPMLAEAQRELERDLRKWLAQQDGAATFTAQRYRNALRSVRRAMDTIKRIEPTVVEGLRLGADNAGIMSTHNLEEELVRLSGIFEGTIQPISIESAAVIAKGDKIVMKRFKASAKRYAGETRRSVLRQLTISRLRGETIDELTLRLERHGPTDWLRVRHNAERLARTEVMNSYNVYHREGLFEAADDDPTLVQRWDASYDRRRCPICASLDGKLIPIKENERFGARWQTSKGRRMSMDLEQPPAHPNCRCVLTPWRMEWEDFGRPGLPPKNTGQPQHLEI